MTVRPRRGAFDRRMRSALGPKVWVWTAAIAAVAAVAVVAPRAYRLALVGSGFSAEMLCGGVFISGRDESAVRSEDLSGPGYALLHLVRKTIEVKEKRVTASLFGLAEQTAIFRDGLGCTLIDGKGEEALRREVAGLLQPLPGADPAAPWPRGEQGVASSSNVMHPASMQRCRCSATQ